MPRIPTSKRNRGRKLNWKVLSNLPSDGNKENTRGFGPSMLETARLDPDFGATGMRRELKLNAPVGRCRILASSPRLNEEAHQTSVIGQRTREEGAAAEGDVLVLECRHMRRLERESSGQLTALGNKSTAATTDFGGVEKRGVKKHEKE